MTGKIDLNHTEFCTRQVRGPQTGRPFRRELNPKLTNFKHYMNTYILNMCINYLKKQWKFPVRLVNIGRFL